MIVNDLLEFQRTSAMAILPRQKMMKISPCIVQTSAGPTESLTSDDQMNGIDTELLQDWFDLAELGGSPHCHVGVN